MSTPLTAPDILWVCELMALDHINHDRDAARLTSTNQPNQALAVEAASVRHKISASINNSSNHCRRNQDAFLIATPAEDSDSPPWKIIHWSALYPDRASAAMKPLLAELLDRGDVELTTCTDSVWHQSLTDKPGAVVAHRLWTKTLEADRSTSCPTPQTAQAETPQDLTLESVDATVHTRYPFGRAEPVTELSAHSAESITALSEAEAEAAQLGAVVVTYTETPHDSGPHQRDLSSAGYRLIGETWHLPGTDHEEATTRNVPPARKGDKN